MRVGPLHEPDGYLPPRGEPPAVKPPPGWAATGPVRLVATDLDGTLLQPDGTVSERTIKAVQAAREAGILVVPVTGRPPRATWEVAQGAGLGPLGACANGAAVVDVPSMEVTELETIEVALATTLVKGLRLSFPGTLFAVEGVDSFDYEAGFFETERLWDGAVNEVEDIMDTLVAASMKLIARRPGSSVRDLLAHLSNGDAGQQGAISVTSSGLDWVEIAAAGISKAYGTRRLCNLLDVDTTQVVAVGDYYNDLPLLAWASRTAAPANALPEILAMVDVVVPPNNEDGVAQLLEAIVEGQASRG